MSSGLYYHPVLHEELAAREQDQDYTVEYVDDPERQFKGDLYDVTAHEKAADQDRRGQDEGRVQVGEPGGDYGREAVARRYPPLEPLSYARSPVGSIYGVGGREPLGEFTPPTVNYCRNKSSDEWVFALARYFCPAARPFGLTRSDETTRF